MSWVIFLEVLRDRLLGFFACRRWRLEGGNRQELVNRRWLGGLFRKSVALGEGGHFVGADPLDESIVVFADSRLGSGAAWPFQQHFQRAVERGLRGLEMAGLELLQAGFKMLVRLGNQICDGIGLRNRSGCRCLPDSLRGRRLRGMGPLLVASAPDRE